MSKQEWPIDFDALVKDSIVEQAVIEKAYNIRASFDPDAYKFKQLMLIDEIRAQRSDLCGNVRADHNSIRIMTDVEADDWQDKRHRETIGALKRIGKRRGGIDRSEFDSSRLAKCESLDVSIAATIITARSENRRHNRMLAVMRAQSLNAKPEGDQT